MRFGYPFEEKYADQISQSFGENPDSYRRFGVAGHTGVDYALPQFSAVYAAAGGRVKTINIDADGYGLFVVLDHGSGLETWYAHLEYVSAQAGQAVRAGELIARSGSSGNSTGPHLHFGVRQAGQEKNGFGGFVDPQPFLEGPAAPPEYKNWNGSVVCGRLNLRLGPGVAFLDVGDLTAGDRVEILDEEVSEGEITWTALKLWAARREGGEEYIRASSPNPR